MKKPSIYPNPIENKLVISSLSGNESSIYIYNSFGTLIKKTNLNGETNFEFDVNELSKGIYFISVIHTDGSIISTQSVIKQ